MLPWRREGGIKKCETGVKPNFIMLKQFGFDLTKRFKMSLRLFTSSAFPRRTPALRFLSSKSGIAVPELGVASKDADGARELYDKWAEDYDEALKSWSYPVPARVAEELIELGVPKDAKLLDLGCGTGMSGEALREAGFDGELVGVDISQVSLDVLMKDKPGLYDSSTVGNLDQRLPEVLGSGEFDAIVSVGVLSYVENFGSLFGEAARLCKPGSGVFLFSHRDNLWDNDDRDCKTAAGSLEEDGTWKRVLEGPPEAYMPDNPDPEENSKRIRLIAYRREA